MAICVTEPRVAYKTEKQLDGWTVFSVNKWPAEQKHKHYALALLLRHGPSKGAAFTLHVTTRVSS